jgi:hypothetical protein
VTLLRQVLHATIASRRPSLAGHATAEDLDLLFDASPLQPHERPLIHAADFRSERALYSLHSAEALRSALDAPFLYAAALDHACGMLSVPFERLHEWQDGEPPRPCFIFSLGRTGSTLLVRLLRAAGCAAASEPDWFTQLCRLDDAARARLGAPMQRALVMAGVASLASALGAPPFIKLRSQCNARPESLVEAVPGARAVLMLRGRRAWALSRRRAFGESPEQIAGMLGEGVAAFDRLAAGGTAPLVMWYEDLLADPVAALHMMLPGRRLDSDALAIVMQEDSQSGTDLSRTQAAHHEADDGFVPAFDSAWRQVRLRVTSSPQAQALAEALER